MTNGASPRLRLPWFYYTSEKRICQYVPQIFYGNQFCRAGLCKNKIYRQFVNTLDNFFILMYNLNAYYFNIVYPLPHPFYPLSSNPLFSKRLQNGYKYYKTVTHILTKSFPLLQLLVKSVHLNRKIILIFVIVVH